MQMVSWLPFKHLKAWKYRNTTFSSQFDDSWYFLDNYVVSSLLIIIFLDPLKIWISKNYHAYVYIIFLNHILSVSLIAVYQFFFSISRRFSHVHEWKIESDNGLHDTYIMLWQFYLNQQVHFIMLPKKLLNAVEVQRHKRKSKLTLAAVTVAFPLIYSYNFADQARS